MMSTHGSQLTDRACYLCGATKNPIVAEEHAEQRFGRPVMPEGVYRFVRCKSCATLYVDSDVNDAYLAHMYESETTDWVREATGGIEQQQLVSARLPVFEAHWSEIRKVRPPTRGDLLLDVGCQTGEFAHLAQRDGVVPHGIELSADYAAHALKRWGAGEVHTGPLASASFGNRRFQYVTAFETLEHVCDPIAELRRMRALIAEDGILAMSVPSTNYFHFKFWLLRRSPVAAMVTKLMAMRKSFYEGQVLPHTHIYNFSDQAVRMLLDRGGFDTVYSGPSGWGSRVGGVLDRAVETFDRASRLNIRMAPSVFAIARPKTSS